MYALVVFLVVSVVAVSAAVDDTAYVGPNARVLDSAEVRGNARIEDYAVVRGTARVLGDAVVSGRLSNTKTLSSELNTVAGEPINLGCQREDADGTRSFCYSGYINTVRIHGGALSANEIAGNCCLGPASRPAE